MRCTTTLVAAAATLAGLAEGHGHVSGTKVNGVWTEGQNPNWFYNQANSPATAGWKALNQDNGFVEPASFGSADISCHKSAKANTKFVTANAGDTVTVYWDTWPETHKGPIINYLAPVSDFGSASAASLSWTKISQGGLISGYNPGTWVTDTLIASNFSSAVKIPSRLKAGKYVLRHEIIALHAAGSDNGAQAYPQCINIQVGGSGSVSLSGGTAPTSLYTRSDPGIKFSLYQQFNSYPIPGPAVFTGAN